MFIPDFGDTLVKYGVIQDKRFIHATFNSHGLIINGMKQPATRQRVEAERGKKLVADLLQDGLMTDPNNVTFILNNTGMTVNVKKQSGELYQNI